MSTILETITPTADQLAEWMLNAMAMAGSGGVGIPQLMLHGRDFYLCFLLELPPRPTAKERKLIERLRSLVRAPWKTWPRRSAAPGPHGTTRNSLPITKLPISPPLARPQISALNSGHPRASLNRVMPGDSQKISTRTSEANLRKLAEAQLQLDELLIVWALNHGFHGRIGVSFIVVDGTIQKIERVFEQTSI